MMVSTVVMGFPPRGPLPFYNAPDECTFPANSIT